MKLKRPGRWAVLLLLLSAPFILSGQTGQDNEVRADSLLIQGDDAYAKGDYQKAIDAYLLVVRDSKNKLNLSRAHLSLSLCYFYLDDTENAKGHILKVLEIDPQKEVSPLFHPQTYVDLFNEVKKENEARLGAGMVSAPAEAPPESAKKPGVEQPAIVADALEEKGGRFEIGVRCSVWTIDPAKGAFEDQLTDRFAEEIREQLNDQIQNRYPGYLIPTSYEDSLAIDSQGSSYGFEIRYYPLGRRGSMSIGFSLDKTKIRVLLKGPVTQWYSDGSAAVVEADAFVETSPLTGSLSFRWDFAPSRRITPYFVLGLGLGPLEGTAAYVYSGTYQREGAKATISGEESKTFDTLREEEDIDLDRFILVHLALGVRARIYEGLTLSGEMGFWDGLILRGGLAYRF
jgi:tetratricopeptide (TPR) repeat protein